MKRWLLRLPIATILLIALFGQVALDVAYADYRVNRYVVTFEVVPNNALAYYNRGLAYYDLRYYERAVTDVEKALELGLKSTLKREAEALLEELKR